MALTKPTPPLTYHRHQRQPGQDTLLSRREVPVAVLAISAEKNRPYWKIVNKEKIYHSSLATTDEEAAGKNRENQSGKGVRGHSSRRARCRKSGRRATNYRLSSGSWAAKTTTIKKLKHEEVVAMVDKRSKGARRSRITDENIRDWVESEAFESRNAASMSILESKLHESSAAKDYPAHGSVEENGPDGVFRGMSVQLNGMVTSKVMNRKARLLTSAIRKYEVQFVGIGEVGVNWKKANRKRLLSLLPELTGEARAMTANNTTENVAVHQQGGVATLALVRS
eukprot:scaffold57678_cov40-Cyclotella_meneghiniana.AAC.2